MEKLLFSRGELLFTKYEGIAGEEAAQHKHRWLIKMSRDNANQERESRTQKQKRASEVQSPVKFPRKCIRTADTGSAVEAQSCPNLRQEGVPFPSLPT